MICSSFVVMGFNRRLKHIGPVDYPLSFALSSLNNLRLLCWFPRSFINLFEPISTTISLKESEMPWSRTAQTPKASKLSYRVFLSYRMRRHDLNGQDGSVISVTSTWEIFLNISLYPTTTSPNLYCYENRERISSHGDHMLAKGGCSPMSLLRGGKMGSCGVP